MAYCIYFSSFSILEVIGKEAVPLIIESFFLPDLRFDFFLSDFCLLGFAPLPSGVFDFSIFSTFSSLDYSCGFLLFFIFDEFLVGLAFGLLLLLLGSFSNLS